MGVSGCYPDRGRFESFPRRSEPIAVMLPESPLARDASFSSWRPGVRFPSGALGGLALTAFSVSDIAGSHGFVTLSRPAYPRRVVVEVMRFFARKAHQRES